MFMVEVGIFWCDSYWFSFLFGCSWYDFLIDEVFVFVFDLGYCYMWVGFVGEDVFKFIFFFFYGYINSDLFCDFFGDEYFVFWENFEVWNYMNKDSVVEDWDVVVKIWEDMLVKWL